MCFYSYITRTQPKKEFTSTASEEEGEKGGENERKKYKRTDVSSFFSHTLHNTQMAKLTERNWDEVCFSYYPLKFVSLPLLRLFGR